MDKINDKNIRSIATKRAAQRSLLWAALHVPLNQTYDIGIQAHALSLGVGFYPVSVAFGNTQSNIVICLFVVLVFYCRRSLAHVITPAIVYHITVVGTSM